MAEPRDPQLDPQVGDTARKGSRTVTITRVDHHRESTDISYIHVAYATPGGRSKTTSLVMYEWTCVYGDHQSVA